MNKEKRKGEKPIPDDVKDYLNDAQRAVLLKIEGFGWSLRYIRRPLFLEPVVVVTNADGSSIGILEDDGRLNMEPDIETSPDYARKRANLVQPIDKMGVTPITLQKKPNEVARAQV